MTVRLAVVKLGGSHARSARLGEMLDVIARHAGGIVVVPGGGPFADTVRAEQVAIGLDDRAAHDMALMAMAQYGRALADLGAGFVLVDDLAGIDTALEKSLVPVWSPWPMLRDHPDIPASWEVTSDSLAIWLATVLAAARVVLVKHGGAALHASIEALAAAGVVDNAFQRFARAFTGDVRIVGPDGLAAALTLSTDRAAA